MINHPSPAFSLQLVASGELTEPNPYMDLSQCLTDCADGMGSMTREERGRVLSFTKKASKLLIAIREGGPR